MEVTTNMNKIIQGDCLEVMKEMVSNSVDTVITDPPYGLSFMGKKWDYDVPKIEIWQECLRVLKPGGTVLIFAGSRTQHRVACGVEDSGFILKDCIMWLYGCLSEDTEILTKRGFKLLHKTTKDDKIMVYDTTKNIYKWETPERWSVYRVHQDTCYQIKSDTTDQIVSRGHRCLVEREGKLVFKEAWELSQVERVPTLSNDFYSVEKGYWELLLNKLSGKSKRKTPTSLLCKRKGKEMSSERVKNGKELSLERWSNLLEEERKLQADKICEVSKGVFTDGEKRWICNGTSFDNGSILGDMLRESSSHTSYQLRPTRQPTGEPDVVSIKQGTQTIRRARVTKIEYSGIIFCPTVSTGAFVARRNGKVFITGNSGFPKATDISKQLDKKAGKKGKIVGEKTHARKGVAVAEERTAVGGGAFGEERVEQIREPATPKAKLWNGWKSHGLKPAYEPILVAMKPNDGSYANNTKHGVSGLNIDGGRIGGTWKTVPPNRGGRKSGIMGEKVEHPGGECHSQGRYPANIILDEEAGKMLDEQSGESKSQTGSSTGAGYQNKMVGGVAHGGVELKKYNDKGGASRFFYCAKSSKSERNSGTNNYLIINVCEENMEQEESQPKDMLELTKKWLIELFGKNIMEKYQMDISSTIKTETKKTTTLITLNWSQHLSIKGYIVDALRMKRKSGGSPVESAESTSELKQIITNELTEYILGVNPALLKEQLKISVSENNFHATVKPLKLMEYLCTLTKTPTGGIVLDPFAGSGTTGVACKNLNRNYILIEKEPKYIEIINKRLQ